MALTDRKRKGWMAEWGWQAPQVLIQIHLLSWSIGYSYTYKSVAFGIGPIQVAIYATGPFRKSASKIDDWA